ncbi:hypothetical protein SAMN05444005_10633 [Flavobacterium urocaniciphilum]|uniref:Uncharacterized protein n=2 Tax=Flavobacterium urocaniciphilum TaxID=1299341 RepID=A0A1H9D4V9_9FLAO|nr:hypothetical protein SAMN05444005_10633 [Flavobacterium urocaniciphilum]
MIKNLFKIGLLIAILLNYSCEKDNEVIEKVNSQSITSGMVKREFSGDSIVLQNPYSLSNMRKSLSTLKEKNPNSTFSDLKNFKIEASHAYIKFKPRTAEEEAVLKSDSTLFLFNYRLDCEYKEGFLENRKATNDTIPDYYTAISIDKIIPNVPFEIIDELYIPEQDSYFNDTTENEKYLINYQINNKTDLFNHLIFDAFVNTGNEDEVLEEGSTESQRWFFGKRWRPAGTIRIWDNCKVGEFVPLEGAKILMRQWFTIDSGITNSSGYFSTGHVRGHARYIIQWERYQYSIRTGNFGQAELRGPKLKKQNWNKDIQGGSDQFHGHIHRAAHHYYYKNIKSLRRPPENGTWKPQMKIGAFNEPNNEINGDYRCSVRFMGILPSIRIYNPDNTSCNTYATTIHELAHASHFNMKKTDFRDSEKIVKESWARGVEWELTRMTYPTYTAWFGRKKGGSTEPSSFYTGVVPDMIDGISSSSSYDQVSGYTIRQIEDALQGKRNWNIWRDNIKNLHNNATENNLDALFDYWN